MTYWNGWSMYYNTITIVGSIYIRWQAKKVGMICNLKRREYVLGDTILHPIYIDERLTAYKMNRWAAWIVRWCWCQWCVYRRGRQRQICWHPWVDELAARLIIPRPPWPVNLPLCLSVRLPRSKQQSLAPPSTTIVLKTEDDGKGPGRY